MAVLQNVVVAVLLWISFVGADDVITCRTPQYVELGSKATIHCSFEGNFYGVYWYNSTDVLREEPILLLQGSTKSGKGYESGEFDIYLNGSLIIKHVTEAEDQDYAVVILNSPSDDPVTFIVHVVVIVKPVIPFPNIDRCKNGSRVCATQLYSDTELFCDVQAVQPAVNLQWLRRTYKNDVNISYQTSTISHDFLYNTVSFTGETLRNGQVLELLVCKALAVPELLENQESLILIQNNDVNLFSGNPASVTVERYSRMEINCTKISAGFLIWKRFMENTQLFENLFIAVYLQENFVKANDKATSFELGHGGSLVSPNVGVETDGRYACVFGNGLVDGLTLFDVIVYVKPESIHPVIMGCETNRYCELHVETRGSLACIVEGIRPEVDLKWGIPYMNSAELSISNQQTKVTSTGETFTVSTTTDFSIESESESNRLTIECRIVGQYAYLFDSSVKADLFFSKSMEGSTPDPGNEVTSHRSPAWILGTTVSVIVLLLIFLLFAVYYVKVKRRSNNKSTKTDSEEKIPMFTDNTSDQRLKEKKELFIKHLKGKYEDLYDAIQPIPYIRDRLYCVKKVYVEGGIDVFIQDKGKDKKGAWERIESYNNILSDSRIKSTRRIVEGDAGYGKTTLTLQFAYDWCKRVEKSPLVEVDILILLRLRQLSGVTSVYRAIRQFLIPRDSRLTEGDIKTLLQTLPPESILVILDGFDEYSDQNSMQETDVMHILRRDMFQQISVILTARPSSITHEFANTKRIRLTGFDELARDSYIRKAVVGADSEAAMRIKHRLRDNPVLADVCQVPLFFVMFAHMTHERDEFTQFHSVTSFFRYMVGCFHGHLHQKSKTKNTDYMSFEKEHSTLDEEALDSLSGERKRSAWKRETLIQLLGQKFYEHYVRVGILVEEEVLDLADENGSNSSYFQPYRKEVRFYHKLFCEWYAAHSLSKLASRSFSPSLKSILSRTDPFELHYLYRFSCGLNATAADNILRYLSGVESSEQFEILCVLEQKGKVENVKNKVEKLCSDPIIISDEDSQLQQRSTIALLEIASSNGIQISCVSVENCIKSVDLQSWNLNLKSGMSLSNLSSIQEISVTEIGRELTEQEAADIITFCFQCLELKVVRFDCCMLPRYIKVFRTESDINQSDIKVVWSCTESLLQLNLTSGSWETQIEGGSIPIKDEEYQSEAAKFRREWSESKAENAK